MPLPIKTGQMFIGLAVIMGLLTFGIMGSAGGGKKKSAHVEKIQTQMVVVPRSSILLGKTITRDDLEEVAWPKEFLPKGHTFGDTSMVLGRVAKQDLYPGQPIYVEQVSGSDTSGGLPAIIPEGYRAVTVAVTEIKGVAGFVKPGDRVDVMTTVEMDDADGERFKVTRTVLQNVLVLASAQTMVDEDSAPDIATPDGVERGEATPKVIDPEESKKDSKKKKKEISEKELEKERKARKKEKQENEKRARLVSSVTLAVTPDQSQVLALAEDSGEIRLDLRPEQDQKVTAVGHMDSRQILGLPAVNLQAVMAEKRAKARKDRNQNQNSGGGNFPTANANLPPANLPNSLGSGSSSTYVRYGTSVELIEGTSKSNQQF